MPHIRMYESEISVVAESNTISNLTNNIRILIVCQPNVFSSVSAPFETMKFNIYIQIHIRVLFEQDYVQRLAEHSNHIAAK